MGAEIVSPGGQPGRVMWISEDLSRSGLTLENFTITPLESEAELQDRLGFTQIARTKIINFGGYWISYPGVPNYCRLKLKEPMDTDSGTVKYLSSKGSDNYPYILPEVRKTLANYSPDNPVFITEGEKKATKATLEGFDCIGLSGVWNFTDGEHDFLPELEKFVWKDRAVFLVFDSDITKNHGVRQAELRLAIELLNHGAKVSSVRLPGEPNGEKNGFDDYLVRHSAESFAELVKEAKPTLKLHVTEGTGATVILKEATRLQSEIIRAQMLKALAAREGVKLDAVDAEYRKHLPEKGEVAEVTEDFTTEQLEEAQNLLRSPDIIDRMIKLTRRLGLTGEEDNQKLLYLSFTSRLMDSSISTIAKGPSASGKSYLVGTVLRLFPKSDVLNFSFITSKALVHRQDDLSHKILFIMEHSGSEGADYSLRTLLSEGEISITLPVKNESTGNFDTVDKRIPAKGLVFVETTTRDRIHHENQTRLFDLYVDESPEQTRRVLEMQSTPVTAENPEVKAEVGVWRAAQTLLKSHVIYIPYAPELAKEFPADKTRARRDFPRLLSLIRAHVLLHQYQRDMDEQGWLVATVEDFESILPLAETVLLQSMKEMNPKQERVLRTIENEFQQVEFSVKKLEVKAEVLVAYRTLQRYCDYFAREGILSWNGVKGAGSRYTLSSPVASCRNRGIFTPKLLKTLKSNYAKPECRNMALCRNGSGDYANYDRPRQTQNGIMKSNDNGGLFPKTRGYDIYDKGAKEVCVPEGYDNRAEEFLNGEAEEEI